MFRVSVESFTMVMEVLGLVFGVIGAFVVFFGFMSEKNGRRYTGRLAKLYDFLNFRFYIIEDVLKFCYVLTACLCTGIGLFMALTVVELTRGLVLLAGGNLAARIAFEFLMMLVKACRNLGEVGKQDRSEIPTKNDRADAARPEAVCEDIYIEDKEEATPEELPDTGKAEGKEKGIHVKIKKEKYKICPSCGESCSGKFEYCNMCGTKL